MTKNMGARAMARTKYENNWCNSFYYFEVSQLLELGAASEINLLSINGNQHINKMTTMNRSAAKKIGCCHTKGCITFTVIVTHKQHLRIYKVTRQWIRVKKRLIER